MSYFRTKCKSCACNWRGTRPRPSHTISLKALFHHEIQPWHGCFPNVHMFNCCTIHYCTQLTHIDHLSSISAVRLTLLQYFKLFIRLVVNIFLQYCNVKSKANHLKMLSLYWRLFKLNSFEVMDRAWHRRWRLDISMLRWQVRRYDGHLHRYSDDLSGTIGLSGSNR